MTENFLRQRRNLFILNGLVLFSFYAKVKIAKFTFAGISFSEFGNPETVYYFIWTILIYFFYRFTLYFIQDEYSGCKNMWYKKMEETVGKKLKKLVAKQEENVNPGSFLSYYQFKQNNWVIKYQDGGTTNSLGEFKHSNHELKVSRTEIVWSQISAITKFCLFTPALTNYLLPITLSLYVFFFVGFSSWEGSLLSIFT
jgi:hypothetical protein